MSTGGPRPLQLVSHSPPNSASPSPRRQSSISYVTTTRSPLSPTYAPSPLSRRNSLATTAPKDSRPRPPLTLAEKHADLLQFIAQKESKCLDLRSQLAAHEAELLQLKRKWERIVRRAEPLASSSPSLSSPPPTSAHAQSIKDTASSLGSSFSATATQGLKLLAAGMGQPIPSYALSPSPSPASPSSSSPLAELPAHTEKPKRTSAGSTATATTRLSQSSVSSFGFASEQDAAPWDFDAWEGQDTTVRPGPAREKQVEKHARESLRGEERAPQGDPGMGLKALVESGWGSVGRRLGELRDMGAGGGAAGGGVGSTLAKSQKRASLLLADFVSVIAPPVPAPVPAPVPSPAPASAPMSLLDEEEGEVAFGAWAALDPQRRGTEVLTPTSSGVAWDSEPGKAGEQGPGGGGGGADADEEEWNW